MCEVTPFMVNTVLVSFLLCFFPPDQTSNTFIPMLSNQHSKPASTMHVEASVQKETDCTLKLIHNKV